jgi:diguanylate cyclase (GGDEF)-like protein
MSIRSRAAEPRRRLAPQSAFHRRRPDEHLVEDSRERAPRPLGSLERRITALLGGGFLAVATALAALGGLRPSPPLALIVALVGAHAFVSRIEFEVGTGTVVPTELVLVPMLFLLPPTIVPLCVALGFVLGAGFELVRGRMHIARVFVLLSSSWHSVGPALVLALGAAPGGPRWSDWPVYVAALAAQLVFDFSSSALRERIAFGVSLRPLVGFFVWIYCVDVLLAPAGLLAAFAARSAAFAFALVLPLAGLFALIARERRDRIDRAVAVRQAYLGASLEARKDALTGVGNRLAWDEAVAEAERLLADSARPVSVLLLDVDELKLANDTHGHDFGDALLAAIASLVRANVRQGDLVARIGGDELAVLMWDADRTSCHETVVRLRRALADHPGLDGVRLSVALGSASCPPARSLSEAVRAADDGMYKAKDFTRRVPATSATA